MVAEKKFTAHAYFRFNHSASVPTKVNLLASVSLLYHHSRSTSLVLVFHKHMVCSNNIQLLIIRLEFPRINFRLDSITGAFMQFLLINPSRPCVSSSFLLVAYWLRDFMYSSNEGPSWMVLRASASSLGTTLRV